MYFLDQYLFKNKKGEKKGAIPCNFPHYVVWHEFKVRNCPLCIMHSSYHIYYRKFVAILYILYLNENITFCFHDRSDSPMVQNPNSNTANNKCE